MPLTRYDSTAAGFRPWWETATVAEVDAGIRRLWYVVRFCRGSASDHRENVLAYIRFLESVSREKALLGTLDAL